MATLRSWLRRSPQPARLRVRVDDEERFINLTADSRNRWKAAEEAVLAMRANVVECIDGDGNVLRAQTLVNDDDEPSSELGEYDRKHEEKLIAKDRREMGAILLYFGDQINKAHERGAAAASASSEALTTLVGELTNHLTIAITNLHNVSVNLAQVVQQQQQEPAGSGNDQLLAQVLGLAAGKDNAKGKSQ